MQPYEKIYSHDWILQFIGGENIFPPPGRYDGMVGRVVRIVRSENFNVTASSQLAEQPGQKMVSFSTTK